MKGKLIAATWILALSMLMTVADNIILCVIFGANFFFASYRLLRHRIAVYRELLRFENKLNNLFNISQNESK